MVRMYIIVNILNTYCFVIDNSPSVRNILPSNLHRKEKYGLITVENLPIDIPVMDLYEAFYRFGTIYDIVQRKFIIPGGLGGAQIMFKTYEEARNAAEYFDGYKYMGNALSVTIEEVAIPCSVEMEDFGVKIGIIDDYSD